jgi:lincosamide nucleotidyltransferase A/C/D/E
MTAQDVVRIYQLLAARGIEVWVDGGFCVDALVGRATREHSDLDIAVERGGVDALCAALANDGLSRLPRKDSSAWSFVLGDGRRNVDVHVFAYDEAGKHLYGIEYPFGSLTGTGEIDGIKVACVAPQWMFRFKTDYAPTAKDIADVAALADRFGFSIPDTHARPTSRDE